MRKFNHLRRPEAWERYFTKYPEGFTIVEALIDWIGQVDNMVDAYNALTDFVKGEITDQNQTIADFISQFDDSLRQRVSEQLESWYEDGTLAMIIFEDIDGIDDSIIYLSNRKKWGVVGDGEHDDTEALERVLRYAAENGCTIIQPNMTLKITRPITVNFDENGNTPHHSFKWIGVGGIGAGRLKKYGSRTIAYNIPAARGAIELLGRNNGLIASVDLDSIQIELDYDSCDPLAFCYFTGDSWLSNTTKVKFSGFNSVLLRNGTAPNAETYANMLMKFTQTDFDTERYVDWDGVTLFQKARFGFAIANERLFRENGKISYLSDQITFDTCIFGGTVFDYIQNAVYNNCMWLIPGNYRPEIDPVVDDRFNLSFISDVNIDGGIGLWKAGGKATLISPYFEDVRQCIFARTLKGNSVHIDITNPTFLGTMNNRPIIDGQPLNGVYAIKSQTPTGGASTLKVRGGSYIRGNAGFEEGFLVNKGFRNIEIADVEGLRDTDITDTFSRKRQVTTYSNPYYSSEVLTFTGKLGSTAKMRLEGMDMRFFRLPKDMHIVKLEVVVSGQAKEAHPLYVYEGSGNDIRFVVPGFGTDHINHSFMERLSAGGMESYTVDRVPHREFPSYGAYYRYPFVEKGTLLSFGFGVSNNPSLDTDTEVVLKVRLEG